jgi:RNA polymerase sigma-70 factor (ECF subfamily)
MTDRAPFSTEEIEAAIAGDRAAVAALTRAFLPRVFGLCLRLSRRRDLAEDATQETFVRALRALPRLRDPARLPSWMLTIAANTVREIARKRPREAGFEGDWEPPAVESADDGREARAKAIDRAVARLAEDERALFLLHTMEGVGLEELARERGTTPQAMKSRVHRIREKVRGLAMVELQAAGDRE